MKFNGFQKLTLLDFPGHVACILFTAGCNFRCPFCHNAGLVTHIDNENAFSEEEVLEYLKKRAGMLEGIVITGGEPLMQPELEDFIIKARELGYKIKLDTNGSYPEKLCSLIEKGLLDYVAMDIKNSLSKYPKTSGCENLDIEKIEKSIDLLMEGRVDYEFRTTVSEELHEEEDIEEIARRIKGAARYFLQNFSDSGDIIKGSFTPVNSQKMEKMQNLATPYIAEVVIRN